MPPNSEETDWVALLGTKGGPAIRPGSTMPTSSLVSLAGRLVVVDCGLGVTRGIVDQGIGLTAIERIVITHLHSDHYLELGPLLHTAWTAGLDRPVAIHGPRELEDYLRNFLASMQADIDLRIADEGRPDLRRLVAFHPIREGRVFADGPLSVHALRNEHPPLEQSYALSFRSGTRHVVFSGDTAFMPALADFAADADLLVHEAMLPQALEALVARVKNGDDRLMTHLRRSHTSAADAARIAEMAGVHSLALHHLIPSDDPDFGPDQWRQAVHAHWRGKLHVGGDGLRIRL